MKKVSVCFLPLLVFLCTPAFASAHAFGTQYTLPLPASFFILGGVCAFLASSVVIFLFSTPQGASGEKTFRIIPYKNPARVRRVFAIVGLLAFFAELVFCFFSNSSFLYNPAIVLFWVYLLLALAYLSVFVDGLWNLLNPFRTVASWFAKNALYEYPSWFGYWPAVVSFFFLIGFELFSNGEGSIPSALGIYLTVYLFFAILGTKLFGAEAWFARGDFFSVFFRTIGTFAPIALTPDGIQLSAPGKRLVMESVSQVSLVVFVLFMLASTALDGIKETAAWRSLYVFFVSKGLLLNPNDFGTVGLIILPFLFFGFYAAAISLMRTLTGGGRSFRHLLLRFGYSLVPIAIAYHFAHYFTLLISEGQRLIYQISDPFKLGWNIFGTAQFVINPVPLGADVIWYIQLSAIVLGHIIAAFIAHRIAVREFSTTREIVASQLPMLVLMVGYTALGLWILSRVFVPG